MIFFISGCGESNHKNRISDGKEKAVDEVESEYEDTDAGEQLFPVSHPESSITEEILDAFLLQVMDWDKEWKICLEKKVEDITVALIIPKDMQEITSKNRVQLKADMRDKQYMVFFDNFKHKFIISPFKERGIVQLCFYEEKGNLYIGEIYKNSFAGWEEFSMKWLCYENGTVSRLWNIAEKENAYDYWKNRKPIFNEDNTISIFIREAEEESFGTLMQNRELMAMDNYSDYVSRYQWVEENTFSIVQWVKEGIYSDNEITAAAPVSFGEKYGLPGTELMIKLFALEEENIFPNPIYFSVGFEGAAVEIYTNTEKEENSSVSYFIVKKYSTSHQAGFQSLYIGSLDLNQGKITQCFEYSGDHSEARFVSCEGQQYILFYAENIYNGIPSTKGGVLKAEKERLHLVWPYVEENENVEICERYWHPCECGKEIVNDIPIHRTARIEDKKLKIYRINFVFDPDSSIITGYHLILEEEIEGKDLIQTE